MSQLRMDPTSTTTQPTICEQCGTTNPPLREPDGDFCDDICVGNFRTSEYRVLREALAVTR